MFTSQMEHTMLIDIFFISYIQRPVTLFLATLRVQFSRAQKSNIIKRRQTVKSELNLVQVRLSKGFYFTGGEILGKSKKGGKERPWFTSSVSNVIDIIYTI